MDAENLLKRKVVDYLKQLELNDEQALAYLYLLGHGPGTVLSISRGLKTGRTKLYPLLEDLAQKQLITVHERHYGTSYEAQPPDALEFLISEKERQAESLRNQLPTVTRVLNKLKQESPVSSKIIEYRGVDGLKQMNWNLTKAGNEYRVFEKANLSKHLGRHFAEKIRQWQVDKKITSLDLTNNPHWQVDTNVAGFSTFSQARFIDPSVFTIEFETYIYNNCVALLSYEQDDILGVEIHNDKLAGQQRQLFNLLWRQGKAINQSHIDH
jgi:sugar-specific transcriptional regulator TrmB